MTTYLLDEHKRSSQISAALQRKLKFVKEDAFESLLTKTKHESLLVADDAIEHVIASLQESFFKKQADLRKRLKILVIADVPLRALPALEALFKDAIVIPHKTALPLEELLEIINDKNAKNYVIGGQIDEKTHTVTLIRGDLSKLAVPFSTFRPSGIGVQPDFTRFSIEDFGQSIKFGDYDSSVHAVLYEFDPLYRKDRKAELLNKDKSFGACLRRLRILKRFKQTDFPGVDAREIGRIERGEVKPRPITIAKIAETLEVKPTEIKTY